MPEHVINIRDDGSIVFLDQPELESLKDLGSVLTMRASHVEPVNLVLRGLFHLLRHMFTDKGWMASFTRLWPCLWRINLAPINGPILSNTYRNRQRAIDKEVEWLNEHLA